jgi:hypothetical protein
MWIEHRPPSEILIANEARAAHVAKTAVSETGRLVKIADRSTHGGLKASVGETALVAQPSLMIAFITGPCGVG